MNTVGDAAMFTPTGVTVKCTYSVLNTLVLYRHTASTGNRVYSMW